MYAILLLEGKFNRKVKPSWETIKAIGSEVKDNVEGSHQ